MNYFIGDLHFGHVNCLSFDNRPFKTIEDHDAVLIKNWNNVVGIEDDVYLKPQTSGAGISPFSTKNLPKSDYIIPADDLAAYKNLTKDIAQEDILIVPQITRRFIKNILSRSKQYRSKDIKVEMRKSMLKGKEFIHYSGMWNEYIKYLKKELSKNDDKNG